MGIVFKLSTIYWLKSKETNILDKPDIFLGGDISWIFIKSISLLNNEIFRVTDEIPLITAINKRNYANFDNFGLN